MKGKWVVKIRIFSFSVAVASTFAVVACSFGPDEYKGVGPCPGPAPADGVQVNDLECHDYSAAGNAGTGGGETGGQGNAGSGDAGDSGEPAAGASAGGSDTAGGGGSDTGGGAGTVGIAGSSAGSGG